MPRVSYVNGLYLPHGDAAVHVEDRGYQFADGVYEVIGVHGGEFIDLEPHFDRLGRSLDALRISWPMSRALINMPDFVGSSRATSYGAVVTLSGMQWHAAWRVHRQHGYQRCHAVALGIVGAQRTSDYLRGGSPPPRFFFVLLTPLVQHSCQ